MVKPAEAPIAGPRPEREIQAALDAAVRGIAGLAAVDDVLQLIVDRVRPLVGARYAALGILDDAGRIERFFTSGIDEATRRRIGPLPQGHGLLGLIIRDNRSLRIRDINADARSYGFPAHHPLMTSFLGAPITYGGRSIGRLYLTDKLAADEFSAADQALVETFAVHAAIAMENARLHEQLQRLAVVEERERISKDLHDGIIQNMYAVSLSLEDVADLMDADRTEAADRVERAIDSIHLAIQDMRNFIFGLRPELLESATLGAGLAALVEDYRHNTITELELHLEPDLPEPPRGVTSQLLGVVSESVSNVVRHARASIAAIELARLPGSDPGWQLSISDNGVGFDPAAATRIGHQGLANIRERVAEIGGDVSIEGRSGRGTRVVVRIPDARGEGQWAR